MKELNNRLIIPTLSGFRDLARTAITEDRSQAALLNLQDDDYILKDRVLYHLVKMYRGFTKSLRISLNMLIRLGKSIC